MRISMLGFFLLSFVFIVWHFDRVSPINMATKTCLITGVSSGLGRCMAIEMVKRGWKVIGIARRIELLNQLTQELGTAMFVPFVCDVSDFEQVHVISDNIKAQGLQPTLFFLNAGMGELLDKWHVSTLSHKRTFATNYFGVIAWIEEWLLPVKQLGGGTFVATSSLLAFVGTPGSDAYGSSKRALLHCFDVFRRQYFYDNIGFSVILPGPIDTAMLKGEAAKDLLFKHTPDEDARYIIDQVFAGKKYIEPSWFYSIVFRILNLLPDTVVIKICGG